MSAASRPLLNSLPDTTPNATVMVNGRAVDAHAGELLIEVLNRDATRRGDKAPPQVCYVPQMGTHPKL